MSVVSAARARRSLAVAATLALVAAGCGGGGDGGGTTPTPTVASIAVTPDAPDTLFAIGATTALSATAKDASGAAITGQSFTFQSGNTAVATVSNAGLVTAVGGGSTTVTASIGSVVSPAVPVRVRQKVAAIAITPATSSVAVGGTLQLAAAAQDATGHAVAGQPAATWQSSDATRAAVGASTGLVTGVAEGQATITARIATTADGTVSATRVITVQASAPSTATVNAASGGFSFSPANVTIAAGGTVTFTLAAEHNASFENTAIASIGFGETATRTFTTPGVYRFRCTAHSSNFTTGMVGTVTVQ